MLPIDIISSKLILNQTKDEESQLERPLIPHEGKLKLFFETFPTKLHKLFYFVISLK